MAKTIGRIQVSPITKRHLLRYTLLLDRPARNVRSYFDMHDSVSFCKILIGIAVSERKNAEVLHLLQIYAELDAICNWMVCNFLSDIEIK